MRNNDESNYHDSPDNNLDRLLELGDPLPGMPEDLKIRIRTRLTELPPESEKKNFLFRKWAIVSPLAAAAVLALFLIFIWPWGQHGTISWADVQKQLEQIHSFTARSYKEISTTDGKQIIKRSKISIKDPGLLKVEYYAPDADIDAVTPGPDIIQINKLDPNLYELFTLHPSSHRAEWVTEIFHNSDINSLTSTKDINVALENWKWMKQIAADKTNYIGDRVINGVHAVGFEFYTFVQDFYVPSDKPVRPDHVQVWVSRDDAVPLLIEVEFQNTEGQKVRIMIFDIQWNVQLNEDLFDLRVPNGWSISRSKIELTSNTRLAPGVTLQIGPEGQDPIVVAGDIIKVSYASQTTHIDSNIPSEMQITIELKPEAAGRLIDYAGTHPNQLIVVNFNGQIKVAAGLDYTRPTNLTFDLSLLGIPMAEFEEKYLIPVSEREKP